MIMVAERRNGANGKDVEGEFLGNTKNPANTQASKWIESGLVGVFEWKSIATGASRTSPYPIAPLVNRYTRA